MTKLKNIVAKAMSEKTVSKKANKTISKKASNFLVDNFQINRKQVSTYGDSEYIINRFKEQYPTIVDGDINDVDGIMEWDIDSSWTGLGFKFEPFVNYIKLSARATIWFKDETGEETYTEEEIDLPVEDYIIKIEYDRIEEDNITIEFQGIEVDLRNKEITVYFNV